MTNLLDDYVARHLTELHAPLSSRFISTAQTGLRVRGPGERVATSPGGRFVILEDPSGNTQIETDDRQHAVVRPATIRQTITREDYLRWRQRRTQRNTTR